MCDRGPWGEGFLRPHHGQWGGGEGVGEGVSGWGDGEGVREVGTGEGVREVGREVGRG